MSRWLAHLLSGVFHPLLVPTYFTWVLLQRAPAGLLTLPPTAHRAVLLVVLASTAALPALATYWLVRRGRASSLLLPTTQERLVPLAITLVGFGFAARQLWVLDPLLGLTLALQAIAVALTLFITSRWLISAHGVGMGGAVGGLLVLARLAATAELAAPLVPVFALALVLAGAVGSARLALAAHSATQVWAGLALGAGIGLGAALVI